MWHPFNESKTILKDYWSNATRVSDFQNYLYKFMHKYLLVLLIIYYLNMLSRLHASLKLFNKSLRMREI